MQKTKRRPDQEVKNSGQRAENRQGSALAEPCVSHNGAELLLRNDGLALYRRFTRRRRLERSDAADGRAVFRYLEVVASIRLQSLKIGVVVLAIAAVSALRGLRHIRAVRPILDAGVAGGIVRRPADQDCGIGHRLRNRSVTDRLRGARTGLHGAHLP